MQFASLSYTCTQENEENCYHKRLSEMLTSKAKLPKRTAGIEEFRKNREVVYIKKQILIINNDLVFCQTLRDTLQDSLTDILYMRSSIEALASFMEKSYCLVILDVQLSDMNGMELLRTLRHTKHTPILALTEPLDIDAQISLLLAGANVFLKKPINIQLCKVQANALIQLYISSEKNRSKHAPIIYGNEFVLIPRYRQVIIDGNF